MTIEAVDAAVTTRIPSRLSQAVNAHRCFCSLPSKRRTSTHVRKRKRP